MSERGRRISRRPLAGRERELTILRAAVERAAGGETTVVLIAGEPGIGKTRLLDELAATPRAAILRAGATDAEGMPSYLLFLEALGARLRTLDPEAARREIGPGAAALAPLFPTVVPPAHAPIVLPAEHARLRLFDAIADWLAAIAAERPLLVLLDDLQWADAGSLTALGHVVRQRRDLCLLVVGAYRPDEAEQNLALTRLTGDLRRLGVLTILPLAGLDDAALADLAGQQLGGAVDQAVVRLLAATSDGVPFFAEELLRSWAEDGSLAADGGHWRLRRQPTDVPRSIVDAVRDRVARLPESTAETIRAAAVIGRSFDLSTLSLTLGLEPETVEERLLPAYRARLIEREDDERYRFLHDTVRSCVEQEIPPLRRRRLHGLIGHALEQDPVDGVDRLAALAFHFGRSGDRRRGAAYARRAAQLALTVAALEDALAAARTAAAGWDAADPAFGEVQLELAAAALLANEVDEAAAAAETARRWFIARGDVAGAGRAARRLGQVRWRKEDLAGTRAAFEQAVAALPPDSPELVATLADLGTLIGVSLIQPEEGMAFGRRAVELAERLGDPRLAATTTRALGALLVREGRLAEGITTLRRAIALADAAGDPAEAAEACATLLPALHWAYDLNAVLEFGQRQIRYAEQCRDLYLQRHLYTWLAITPGARGEWAAAEQMLARAQAVTDRLGSPEPQAFLIHARGVLALWRGDLGRAEMLLEEAVDRFRALSPGGVLWYLGPLGYTAGLLGKVEKARTVLAEIERLLPTVDPRGAAGAEALAPAAALAALLGDVERTRRYAQRLAPFRGWYIGIQVDWALGRCAIVLGQRAEAERYLADAEAAARRQGAVVDVIWVLEARAEAARRANDREGAHRALREAIELSRSIDAGPMLQRLQAQLVSPRPAGLTEREIEVLRLVADGLSNREIAARLVISEKTVTNHLTAIFNKTGVANRAAAAAFAIRHGLR